MALSELDAILFDAGGVLILPDPAVTGGLLAGFGSAVDEATLVRAHFVAAHAMDHARSDGERADWAAYHRGYVSAAGVPAERLDEATAAFTAEFDHWMWRYPVAGARQTLAALVERGVPVGIVSNAAGQVEAELARLGICRAVGAPDVDGAANGADDGAGGATVGVPVTCVLDSHLVGVAKPNPRIFDGALAALGLSASPRIGYVGDTVFYDVRAATAAGLRPILHDPYGFHTADPHPAGPPDTIADLAMLLDLV